ncbi:M1 family metallopeptidase [Pseudoduganella chitinolytica]|uniref:M1 family metallopeptidase n=1 Tax=Pseudoduganella chitinolytica TaxID=34070 RepID=A0ABY8BM27_9BURK|nr:M1 family metallopeptidase [Pseudoduganella chitinolytica]WEF35737.1 M1 family metallopeptidase [Pseudoduganella chitinolytica]
MPFRRLPLLAVAALAVLATSLGLAQVVPVAAPTVPEIPFAPAHAAAVRTPSAPTAWGGPRTGAEPTLSDRVANYRIEATLDPVRHTIEARQQLTWRNRSALPIRSVYLHLYLNAHRNEDSTFYTEERNGGESFRSGLDAGAEKYGYTELRSVRQGARAVPWRYVQPDGGPATDRTVVRFDLPEPVAPGGTTTLDIAFFDQLPRVTVRTGYFDTFHLVAQWFPKIGVLELPGERGATTVRWNVHEYHAESEYYADFGHYDVRLTVPKGYTVGATGQLQGKPVEKDGLVTHRYVQGDVHDFAWTADRRTAPPLRATWRGGPHPVEVTVLFPPEYRSNAAPVLRAMLDGLDFFSRTLGPYPYRTVTAVIPPYNGREASGMEYPTFFTADSVADPAPGTLGAMELDFVTIHEFGHGYFQGILASNEFEEPMLDEGLNEFWGQRMLHERGQKLHATTSLLRRLGFAPAFDVFENERASLALDEPADPLGENAWARLEGVGPVYGRTAVMLRDLEAQLGKDVMERAMRTYYQRWKFRHPSIADLHATLAEASGQAALVDAVFELQVYGAQPVDDRIADFTSDEMLPQPGYGSVGGREVNITLEAADEAAEAARARWRKAHPDARPGTGPFPYRTAVVLRRRGAAVPQTLVVTFADGSRETVRWQGQERWQRFEWVKPVQAVSAQLDPARQHLLDANKLDDGRTLQADASATRRWTFDFGTIVQTLLALLATV